MVRIKHRYVITQIICHEYDDNTPKTFSSQDILNVVREKLSELYGDVGFGLYGKNITVKYFDSESTLFILRIPREAENQARMAITCMNNIKKASCISRTLEICGSERTCKEKVKKLLIKLAELKFPDKTSESYLVEVSKITKTVNHLDL